MVTPIRGFFGVLGLFFYRGYEGDLLLCTTKGICI